MKFFLLLLLPFFLYANELVLQNLQEREFSQNALLYILKASKKTIKPQKLQKFTLFNRKKIASEAMFYDNGTLFQKDIKVDFERAYFYEGDLYMQNCYSSLGDGYIKSDFAIYKKDYIEFKKLVMKKDNKIYHKFKYLYRIKP